MITILHTTSMTLSYQHYIHYIPLICFFRCTRDITSYSQYRKMSDTTRSNNYTSEASRMLEQALEQMDGIIQGAKYELPQYFETFSLQVGANLVL